MCCQNFRKGIFVFAATLFLGVFVGTAFQSLKIASIKDKIPSAVDYGETGGSSGYAVDYDQRGTVRPGTNALQILSKPRPNYTNSARQNQVTGVVRLRVTFLASGEIGSVATVSGLQDGLTEQAINAAENITFYPATKEGKAITVTKLVEYSFSIY